MRDKYATAIRQCRIAVATTVLARSKTDTVSDVTESAVTVFLARRGRADDPKLLHLVSQRCTLHSQALGGAVSTTHDPVACFKHAEDMVSLHFFKPCHGDG